MFPFLKKDENVKIRFMFGKNRMTWDDLNTIELLREGAASSLRLMQLAARFMVDEKNQYLSHDKAQKVLGGLNENDIKDVIAKFVEALNDTAVPPTNAPTSKQPSEALESEHLDGQLP